MSEPSTALVRIDPDQSKDIPAEFGEAVEPNYYCRGRNAKRRKYCKARAGFKTDHPGTGRCNMHGGNARTTHGLQSKYRLRSKPLGELLEKHRQAENALDISSEIALLRALTEDWLNRNAAHLEQLAAWHAQRRLDPDQMSAMYQLIDEFEANMKEQGDEASPRQLEMIALARQAVSHLGEDIPRPATVPDLVDAVKIIAETTRSVERVFNMRAKMAITFDQLQRFLFAAHRHIEGRVRAAITDPKIADAVLEKISEDIRGIRP